MTETRQIPAFLKPLRLEPQGSKRFALLLMLIHSGALLCLLPLKFPIVVELALGLKLSIGLLILANAWYTLHHHWFLTHHPLYGCLLSYDETKRCLRVQLKSGSEVFLASGIYNHPQCVILRIQEHKQALILFPDALEQQTFRQLRVLLRFN